MPLISRRLLASLVFGLLCGLAGPVHAQRGGRQAEQEVDRLLEEARQAYDNLELDQADQALVQAVDVAERNDLHNRSVAECHIQRGIIAHVRDKDKDRAVEEFKQALTIDRSSRLDSLVSTPSMETLFETARRQVGPPSNSGGGRRQEDEITHNPIKRARANEILAVHAKVMPDLRERMYRMYLYFRPQKVDAVRRIEMKDQGDNTYVARIASKFVKGTSLWYYILVEDRDGNQIAQIHTSQDPISVPIDDFATGDSLTGEEGGEEGSEEEGGGDTPSPRRRLASIGVAVGTGFGRITDSAVPQIQGDDASLKKGMAWSPFHTLVELDFWVTTKLSLGGFARIQIADFSHLEGGRVKFDVLPTGKHHLNLRLGAGYGHVAHQVPLQRDGQSYTDYTLEGPYFYTLGVTYALDFNKTWALTVTPDFYHLIGPSPSQHFDVSVGGQVSF